MSQTRLESEARETAAALDGEKDRAAQLERSLDVQRMQLEGLKNAQAVAVADDREKRKAEMLAEMMSKIDKVNWVCCHVLNASLLMLQLSQGGAFMDQSSEKLRIALAKLDNVPVGSPLLQEDVVLEARETIRRHLADNQTVIRDLQDKLRRSEEDAELHVQRSDDLQELLERRDAAYEDLLSMFLCSRVSARITTYGGRLFVS